MSEQSSNAMENQGWLEVGSGLSLFKCSRNLHCVEAWNQKDTGERGLEFFICVNQTCQHSKNAKPTCALPSCLALGRRVLSVLKVLAFPPLPSQIKAISQLQDFDIIFCESCTRTGLHKGVPVWLFLDSLCSCSCEQLRVPALPCGGRYF